MRLLQFIILCDNCVFGGGSKILKGFFGEIGSVVTVYNENHWYNHAICNGCVCYNTVECIWDLAVQLFSVIFNRPNINSPFA